MRSRSTSPHELRGSDPPAPALGEAGAGAAAPTATAGVAPARVPQRVASDAIGGVHPPPRRNSGNAQSHAAWLSALGAARVPDPLTLTMPHRALLVSPTAEPALREVGAGLQNLHRYLMYPDASREGFGERAAAIDALLQAGSRSMPDQANVLAYADLQAQCRLADRRWPPPVELPPFAARPA